MSFEHTQTKARAQTKKLRISNDINQRGAFNSFQKSLICANSSMGNVLEHARSICQINKI